MTPRRTKKPHRTLWLAFILVASLVLYFAISAANPLQRATATPRTGTITPGTLTPGTPAPALFATGALTPSPTEDTRFPEFATDRNITNGIVLGSTILVLIVIIGTITVVRTVEKINKPQ